MGWIYLSGDHSLQGHDHQTSDYHSIYSFMRSGGMAAFAIHGYIKSIGRSVDHAFCDNQLSGLIVAIYMATEYDTYIIEPTMLYDFESTIAHLFGWLKNQTHRRRQSFFSQ